MNKYKHVSGIEVQRVSIEGSPLHKEKYYYKTTKGELLPEWIVQGKDWEEVQETYFGVHKENFTLIEVLTTKNDISCDYTFFRTKSEAEEYILNNKPCLSLNDVRTHSTSFVQIALLEKLIKMRNTSL